MQSIKNIAKRFLSLSLSLIMLLVLIPSMTFNALADEVTGLSDTSIVLSTDGDAVCTATGNSLTVSVTGDGQCSRSKTGTLTIKNGKGMEAVLKFDYALTLNGGMVSVDGTAISTDISGAFEKTLAAEEAVNISIQSPANGNASTVDLTNITLLADVDANVTFIPGDNGTYTVDGTAVTASTTITKNSSDTFKLAATPASGYKFLGWKDVDAGNYISFDASFETGFDRDLTVQPVFTGINTPVFSVEGTAFTDLDDATSYALANNKTTVVLVGDGTLAAGDYTIPTGVALLIPYDSSYTFVTTAPEVVHEAHVKPTPYKTLTLADGAKINIESGAAITVGSKVCAYGTNTTSWNGTPTGKYGHIVMSDGSAINVKSGGYLFAYGYISGSGSVDVLSGGNVYELFQLRCWRGGSATTNEAFVNNGVFPMSQYYVQNIESSLTIEPGAKETVVAAVNAQGMAVSAAATFIGNGGMFVNQGTVTKKYDGAADRLIIDVDGNVSISPLQLSAGGMDLNTQYFVLPINNNISISINSGITTLAQDVGFLPGSEIFIADGAELNISTGTKAFVYDVDEWGAYAAAGAQIVPIGYSTVNGATNVRTAEDLTDAIMDINGTVWVNGEFYTTQGGAQIISSEGTGKIAYNNDAGTLTETFQCTQSNTTVATVSIPVTSSQLKNGNAEVPFTQTDGTVSDDYYTYTTRKDMWIKGDDFYYTINFKNWDGTVLSTVLVDPDEVPAYDGEEPTKEEDDHFTYEFAGWDDDVVAATEDKSYTAVFNRIHKDGWYNDGTFIRYYEDNAAVTGIARVPYPTEDIGIEYAEDAEGVNDEGFPNDGKGTFIFDANGILHWDVNGLYEIDGSIPINADYPTDYIAQGETVYVKNGEIIWHPGEVEIDGDTYYFAAGNDMIKGCDYYVYRVSDVLVRNKKYTFDADGKLCKYNGLVDVNGTTYYYENYAKTYAGLIEIDGDYYYINSACQPVKNRSYYVAKTNGLLPAGSYDFDADGKMKTVKNGIVKEADGWFYYENNKRVYKGLFKIGGDYYYAKSNCEVLHSTEYYISRTNGLLPQGKYTFDAEGKLVMLDGIVQSGGKWYYYVNGAKTYAGLIEIDGDYYYVKSDCTVVKGAEYYVSKTNGLLPAGRYSFDADGKMIILDGIVKDGDDWTYYENGAKVYAGLIEIDGYYYYVNSSFKVIHGKKYAVCKTNGVVAQGMYTFDADGHMVL